MNEVTRIGRYRLLDVSGTGTFATVHRAEDERLGDIVALKVLAENHSLDADVRERFLREGRALRRIASPHVVAVHDMGETERQQPYLVMQHADRGTLADRVRARRREGWAPTPEDVRTVASSLAEAITATHRASIVHRDLSPRNVLLRSLPHSGPDGGRGEPVADPNRSEADDGGSSPSGSAGVDPAGDRPLVGEDEQLLLADLGLSKDLALHSGLTAAGGTHGFRPPEQRTGAGFVSPAADLWSMSALVTWLVIGRSPRDDEDVTDDVVARGLPAELGAALGAGLASDPEARPPDAEAWLDGIEAALADPEPQQETSGLEAATGASAAPSPSEDASAPDAPAQASAPQAPAAGTRTADASTADASTADAAETGAAPGRASTVGDIVRRRPWSFAAIAAVVIAVAVIVGLLAGDDVTRTELAGDDVLLERTSGDARLGLAGPAELEVGERATFVAEFEGIVAASWFAPDGTVLSNTRTLTFSTSSEGTARVYLVGRTEAGELLHLEHDLRVRQADG